MSSDLSLEQVEGDVWEPAAADAGYLVRTCHELGTVPLRDLGVEGLRLLIGQQIGTDVLTPIAVGLLQANPLAEGDMYPGDLLVAVLRLPAEWFAAHPGVAGGVDQALAGLDLNDPAMPIGTDLPALVTAWRNRSAGHG